MQAQYLLMADNVRAGAEVTDRILIIKRCFGVVYSTRASLNMKMDHLSSFRKFVGKHQSTISGVERAVTHMPAGTAKELLKGKGLRKVQSFQSL